ncbi:hypothetical protein Tco_0930132 [Tanacetum coccineum]
MTKVIKEEFEKLESLKISDDSFTCNTSLKNFHKEFNQMSRMGDDLFTYEVEIPGLANIPCDLKEEDDSEQQMTHGSDDDMEYDPSNAEFTEWIETNVFDFETPTYRAFKEYLLQIDPHTNTGIWKEPTPVKHHYEPFNYKNGCSEWPTCNWKDDGYCNGGNLPGAYIVRNTLRYQDLEWYEALEDGKLKDEAIKNKAIMEGMIDEDDDSHNKGWRKWDDYENTVHDHEEREDGERDELFNDTTHERPVCNIRRFEMIKYSFGQDEEYVAVKEHEYDDLTSTNEDASRTYQEIFHRMDEGWMDHAEKKSTMLVKYLQYGIRAH